MFGDVLYRVSIPVHSMYFAGGDFDSNVHCMHVYVHSVISRRHVLPYVSSISSANLCNYFNTIKLRGHCFTSTRILLTICNEEI